MKKRSSITFDGIERKNIKIKGFTIECDDSNFLENVKDMLLEFGLEQSDTRHTDLAEIIKALAEKASSYEQSRCVEDQNVAFGISLAMTELRKLEETK